MLARRVSYLHEIDKETRERGTSRAEGGMRKEVRKCPLGDIGGAFAARCRLWCYEHVGKKGGSGRKNEGGGRRMLFRTAKLNYQIKQQRRYINKIDFARRSSKGKRARRARRRRFASNLVSRNSRFNHVARLKRSLFIFVINPACLPCANDEEEEEAGGRT